MSILEDADFQGFFVVIGILVAMGMPPPPGLYVVVMGFFVVITPPPPPAVGLKVVIGLYVLTGFLVGTMADDMGFLVAMADKTGFLVGDGVRLAA